MKMRLAALLAGLLGAALPTPAAFAADPSYRLARTIPSGGEGGWDYLSIDAAARRLYVSRGTRVSVLNADSGTVEGEIQGTEGVHGVALAPDLGRGFTSNGRANTITIFDPKTLATRPEVIPGGTRLPLLHARRVVAVPPEPGGLPV